MAFLFCMYPWCRDSIPSGEEILAKAQGEKGAAPTAEGVARMERKWQFSEEEGKWDLQSRQSTSLDIH